MSAMGMNYRKVIGSVNNIFMKYSQSNLLKIMCSTQNSDNQKCVDSIN